MGQKYPTPITAAMLKPAYVPLQSWNGGVYGDEYTSESNVLVDDQGIGDYSPRNRTDQLATHSVNEDDWVEAPDITVPRGWIAPNQPITPAPVSPQDDPVLDLLTPNTGPVGGAPIWVNIAGMGFTQWSEVEVGTLITPYAQFINENKMAVLMDPRSIPGTVTVRIHDHGTKSEPLDFTFT